MKGNKLIHLLIAFGLFLTSTACGGLTTPQNQGSESINASPTAQAPSATPRPTNTPEPTPIPVPCATEDFTNPEWVIVNNLGTAVIEQSVGNITVQAVGGNQDLYAGYNIDAPRVIKRYPVGDFQVTTRVKGSSDQGYGGFQAAGLIIYFNSMNYAWVGISANNQVESAYTLMGTRNNIFSETFIIGSQSGYVAFKTEGTNLYAGYSSDGITYQWSDPVVFDTSNIRIGVTVLSAWPESPGYTGLFDCFEVVQTVN